MDHVRPSCHCRFIGICIAPGTRHVEHEPCKKTDVGKTWKPALDDLSNDVQQA